MVRADYCAIAVASPSPLAPELSGRPVTSSLPSLASLAALRYPFPTPLEFVCVRACAQSWRWASSERT